MITRAQMQRQLRNNGGIMTVKTIRKKYGLGSDLKSFVRKIIPNEIADIAVKAAPFVAPFNPGAAAIMRGVGRFDQRGSISDALKQGALTYAGGQGLRYLGGAGLQKSFLGTPGDRFTSPFGTDTGLGKFFKPRIEGSEMELIGDVPTKKRSGPKFMQTIADKITKTVPVLDKLPDKVLQAVTVGGITAGASLLASYFQGEFRPQEEGESIEDYLAARKEAVGTQMRSYMDNYFKFDKEYSTMTDAQRNQFVARYNVRDGGRIGFNEGTPQEMFPDNIDNIGPRKSAPRLRKMPEFKGNEVKPSDMMMAGPVLPPDPTQPVNPFGPKPGDFGIEEDIPIKMASNIENDKILEALFEKYIDMGLSPKDAAEAAQKEFDRMSMMKMKDRTMADKGGVMGIPVRMNSEGIKELDMRKTGGFVPIGVKEKADDVPAMLSKNEFVMTADAVRAAGGGSVQKGAQRMYDTMKRLESRVA
jgi:hypothetical protein